MAPVRWRLAAVLAVALVTSCSPGQARPTIVPGVTPQTSTPPLTSLPAATERDATIWKEFVVRMKAGDLTTADIEPYPELARSPGFRDTILGFLRKISSTARWSEWSDVPEVHRVGSDVHFLARITEGDAQPAEFVFTFYDPGERWFFRHLEAITVRLDRVGPLPASDFPDIDRARALWMVEENTVTEQVRLFRLLVKEKGREFALGWFRDGAGYWVQVKTWVPWVDPARAFVLYLCWERAKLHGDHVVLRQLDNKAEVALESNFLLMYERTAHIAKMISREDFRALFETVWRDRATNAGWSIDFEYGDGGNVVFHLSRNP